MKSIFQYTLSLLAACLLWTANAQAQSAIPVANGLSYQAMLTVEDREVYGTTLKNVPVTETSIQVKFTLSQGSASAAPVYQETQSLTTDRFGIFATIIGTGQASTGNTPYDIDWFKDSTFLTVSIDQGSGYEIFSQQKLWSTAYAFHAKSSDYALLDNDTSASNELQVLTLVGDDITLSLTNSSISLKPWSDGIAKNAADLASEVARAKAAEAANAMAISSEEARAKAAEAANASDIANNATNIASNTSDIAANTSNIASNSSAIAANASDIATNTSNISTNASAIAANATSISNEEARAKAAEAQLSSDLAAEVTRAKAAEAANASAIAAEEARAKAAESQLTTDLAAEITRAKAAEAANAADIAQNQDSLSAHNKRISKNAADLASLSTDVATNKTNIASNSSAIASETSRAKAAESQLGTDLATEVSRAKAAEAANASAISTNASDIAANSSAIAANATDIASNASDIAAHNAADADLSATNEIQTLSLSGNTLSLSNNGGSVTLSDNDKQTLTLSGQNLSISNGNSVTLPTGADNLGNHTATQNIRLNGKYLSNDGGNEGIAVDNNGRVGIGTNAPKSSAALDITSTTGTLLPPRMTEAQRNAISGVQAGAVVFNSSSNKLQVYTDSTNFDYKQGPGIYQYDGPYHLQTFRPTVGGKLLKVSCVSGQRFTFVTYLNCDLYEGDPSGTLTSIGSADNTVKMTNPTGTTFPPKVYADFTFNTLNKSLESGKTYTFVFTAKDSTTGALRQCWFLVTTSSGGNNSMGEYWRGGNLSSLTQPSNYDMDGTIALAYPGPGWTDLNADFTEVDGSTTNEIQTLSLSGNTLSISNGNSITLTSSGASELKDLSDAHTYGTGSVMLGSTTTGTINNANHNFSSGQNALKMITTGDNNIAIGYNTLDAITTSGNLVAMGYAALGSCTTATNSIAIGYGALSGALKSSDNIAIGHSTMTANTIGYGNTAMGYSALSKVVNYLNTAVGYNAGKNTQTSGTNTYYGGYNTFMGGQSGENNTLGSHNTSLGFRTLWIPGSYTPEDMGDGNVALGSQALWSNTGSQNVAIGFGSNMSSSANNPPLAFTGNNTITIGRGCQPSSTSVSNEVRLGNTSITSLRSQVSLTVTSDARVKQNIQNSVHGLDFIMKLNPVTYNYSLDAMNALQSQMGFEVDTFEYAEKRAIEDIRFSGFLAQDVEAAASAVGYEFSGVDRPKTEGAVMGLRYSEFVVPLVKAMQEQQNMIEEQKQLIDSQQQAIEALMKRLEALENK